MACSERSMGTTGLARRIQPQGSDCTRKTPPCSPPCSCAHSASTACQSCPVAEWPAKGRHGNCPGAGAGAAATRTKAWARSGR